MVDITLLELHLPDARFDGEATFNAPYSGRSDRSDDEASPAERSPAAPALAVGLALVATALAVGITALVRRRRRATPEDAETVSVVERADAL